MGFAIVTSSVVLFFTLLVVFSIIVLPFRFVTFYKRHGFKYTVRKIGRIHVKNFDFTKQIAFWLPEKILLMVRIIWFLATSIPFMIHHTIQTNRANAKIDLGE